MTRSESQALSEDLELIRVTHRITISPNRLDGGVNCYVQVLATPLMADPLIRKLIDVANAHGCNTTLSQGWFTLAERNPARRHDPPDDPATELHRVYA